MKTMGKMVVQLSDPDAALALAGGKGQSLSRMIRAGFPVPDGFCVTTDAYRDYVRANSLRERILCLVREADAEDKASLDAACGKIARAFAGGSMPRSAEEAIRNAYLGMEPEYASDSPQGSLRVAVRSSATAEDLPSASFAGQQDSYLNIQGPDAVLETVKKCWASLWNARAIAYRAARGIAPEDVEIAVVVQELVVPEASGVMFTANPVKGNRGEIVINAAWGLGEAVVGGQVSPDAFVIEKKTGRVANRTIAEKMLMTALADSGTRDEPVPAAKRGEPALKNREAERLAKIGARIEKYFGMPMDVEWAMAKGEFAVLQARPITNLSEPAAPGKKKKSKTPAFPNDGFGPFGEWNDSRTGSYLWSSVNASEAVPDAMTPSTWSLWWIFHFETNPFDFPGNHPLCGNICGRPYFNISLLCSVYGALGVDARTQLNEDFVGSLPDGVDIPLLPMTKWQVISAALPGVMRKLMMNKRSYRDLARFIADTPAWCRAVRERIRRIDDAAGLLELWRGEIKPMFVRACWTLRAVSGALTASGSALRSELRKLAGEADANAILSNMSGPGGSLESLGPLLGIARLARGELGREEYLERYGHRGPHEMELSIAGTDEDPSWLEGQLALYARSPADARALLSGQRGQQSAAWKRFESRYPGKARVMHSKVEKTSVDGRNREAVRSEVTRLTRVVRAFLLRSGALSGIGEGIFLLSLDETAALLGGDASVTTRIAARRETHRKHQSLPAYPPIIVGEFDPESWASDPRRRFDIFDARKEYMASSDGVIKGCGGAAGIVEGRVRRLDGPEESGLIEPGEILVTATTNIGWTPIFPCIAAVVTDVGAPLSHAAIVARELGIPAVVGCGNATARLRTGDRVRVDGGAGIVTPL